MEIITEARSIYEVIGSVTLPLGIYRRRENGSLVIENCDHVQRDSETVTLITESGTIDIPRDARVTVKISIDESEVTAVEDDQ